MTPSDDGRAGSGTVWRGGGTGVDAPSGLVVVGSGGGGGGGGFGGGGEAGGRATVRTFETGFSDVGCGIE